MRPGINFELRDVPVPRAAPTDTGVWFVVGLTERGSLEPTLIGSMTEYGRRYGERVSYGLLYDALDTFFHEGGRYAYVSRIVGDAADSATLNLYDSATHTAGHISLVVTAKSDGDWGNDIEVAVIAGDQAGEFKVRVTYLNEVVETSPSLADNAAAVEWSAYSDYVDLALGDSVTDPETSSDTALTGGDDDRASIVEADWTEGLDRFGADYGPGQVSMPGRTTDDAHANLFAHAEARNRVALVDFQDTSDDATLLSDAAVDSLAASSNFGAGFAPWINIPGIASAPTTAREAPPTALIAGLLARNDVSRSPNQPAAGEAGQAVWVIGVKNVWVDADREDLNEGGVNVIRSMFGGVRNYGWRSLADPVTDSNWLDFGGARTIMAYKARGLSILEKFIFAQIDGRGRLLSQVAGELTALAQTLYSQDALYGATPAEAFNVDVGDQVNTPETLANNELHAEVALRTSPMAEMIVVGLTKVPVTQSVA